MSPSVNSLGRSYACEGDAIQGPYVRKLRIKRNNVALNVFINVVVLVVAYSSNLFGTFQAPWLFLTMPGPDPQSQFLKSPFIDSSIKSINLQGLSDIDNGL